MKEAFNMTELSGRADLQIFVEGCDGKGRDDPAFSILKIISMNMNKDCK